MRRVVALISLYACLTVSGSACGTGTSQAARAAQNQQVYELYRQYMIATNQERQQAGLPPLEVRSYEEFRRSPGTG